jgi:hypothetical protein
MVRGRRQDPQAPHSKQLLISRAFRQRRACALQSLRDQITHLEKECHQLKEKNKILTAALEQFGCLLSNQGKVYQCDLTSPSTSGLEQSFHTLGCAQLLATAGTPLFGQYNLEGDFERPKELTSSSRDIFGESCIVMESGRKVAVWNDVKCALDSQDWDTAAMNVEAFTNLQYSDRSSYSNSSVHSANRSLGYNSS